MAAAPEAAAGFVAAEEPEPLEPPESDLLAVPAEQAVSTNSAETPTPARRIRPRTFPTVPGRARCSTYSLDAAHTRLIKAPLDSIARPRLGILPDGTDKPNALLL